MTAPLTPITPSPSLGSPVSLVSEKTLVDGSLDPDHHTLSKVPETSSSASLVLDKLQSILEPDELSESLGSIPHIVVIGMESSGKSSLISALTNVPLHIAGRTATRAPMRIACTKTPGKRFTASITIEACSSLGPVKRHAFARDITQRTELQNAIRLAGDEARRVEVEGVPRNYTELLRLTEAQRLESLADWPEYTMNTVVMNISGPEQDEIHMTDLPGIGQKSTSDAVTNLINHHAQKKENVIVHCMAASGSAPTADKCIELNMEVDPNGDRTMIVMTKADRIEDLDDNIWVDMITDLADRFDGWSSKLGVFPVRLAGPKEIKAGLVPSQVRAIEQQLFNSPGWMTVAKSTGQSGFGIHVARQKVLDLHKERIGDWLKTIPALIVKNKRRLAESQAILPRLPDNPITALHDDIIAQFATNLRKELVVRSTTYNQLADLQKKLMKDLCKCLPAVIPLFKKDEAKIGLLRTEMGRPMCSGMASGQERLWIDDMIKLRDEFRSPRNGKCDDAEILALIIRDALAACEAIVADHVGTVFTLVEGSIGRLANIRVAASSTIIQAMSTLLQVTASGTTRFSADVLEVGASDPASTAVHGQSFAHGLRCTARYTVENFDRIYRPAKSSSSPGSGNSPDTPPTVPAEVTEDDVKDVLRLQSEIDIHLGLSVYRIGTMIGQKVQVDILAMLDQVEKGLRSAFQLDRVEDSVRKRSRELFETSGDRAKRAKLMEKEKSLSEVQMIIQEANTE